MVTSSLSARQHTKKPASEGTVSRGAFQTRGCRGGTKHPFRTLEHILSRERGGGEEGRRGGEVGEGTQFSRASCDAEVPVPVVASRASTLPSSPSTLNRWFSNLVDSARLRQETRWELWRRRRRRAWRRVRCNVFINITAQQRAPYKQRRGPKLTGRVSEAHSTRVD